jgi:hypothetical protein
LAHAPHRTTTQRPAEASCARVMPVEGSMPAIVCSRLTLHRRHDAAAKKWARRRITAACPMTKRTIEGDEGGSSGPLMRR